MTCENYLVTIVLKFSDEFLGQRHSSLTSHLVVAIVYRSEAPLQQCVPFITHVMRFTIATGDSGKVCLCKSLICAIMSPTLTVFCTQ